MQSLERTGMDEYSGGRLNKKSLQHLLKFTSKRPDFSDINKLFTPTEEDRLNASVDAAHTVYSCRFDEDLCDHE